MIDSEEFSEKLARLHKYFDAKGIDGVLLSKVSNFAWATGGGKNFVGTFTESGAASLCITKNHQAIICDNIEASRIASEEKLNLEIIEVGS